MRASCLCVAAAAATSAVVTLVVLALLAGAHGRLSTSWPAGAQRHALVADSQLPGELARRRSAVREAMQHAWHGYRTAAWGRDEVRPVSGQPRDWLGVGLSIVSALDTLYLMDLPTEYAAARGWVIHDFDVRADVNVSVFETSIRVLGGLLGASEVTGGDPALLRVAERLADVLLHAFHGRSPIPYGVINLAHPDALSQWHKRSKISIAEAGTLSLEWAALSRQLGRFDFAAAALEAVAHMMRSSTHGGLPPSFLQPLTGRYTNDESTRWSLYLAPILGWTPALEQQREIEQRGFGSSADSYYEYLLKWWWWQGGPSAPLGYWQVAAYRSAVRAMKDELLRITWPNGLLHLGMTRGHHYVPEMDQPTCFVPAMLALGAVSGASEAPDHDMHIARELLTTCMAMYQQQPTRLAPDLVRFVAQSYQDMTPVQHGYLLRPETLESLYVLHQLDPAVRQDDASVYQDWSWDIFLAINATCRVPGGFSGLRSTRTGRLDDLQQAYFLSETLKYVYLVHSPRDWFPLDQWVFTTEAHPLRRVSPLLATLDSIRIACRQAVMRLVHAAASILL